MKEILNNFEYLPMLSLFIKQLSSFETSSDIILYNKDSDYYWLIDEYTDFITQPLTKGMFVPCDEEGNVLKKVTPIIGVNLLDAEEYQQAKERVLFENNPNDVVGFYTPIKTIEDVINAGVKLKLKG